MYKVPISTITNSRPFSQRRHPLHSPLLLPSSRSKTAFSPLFAGESVNLNSTDELSIHAESLSQDQIKAEKVEKKSTPRV